MTLKVKKLTFLHVLLIVLSVGALVRMGELGTALAKTEPAAGEKIEVKGATSDEAKEETKDVKNADDKTGETDPKDAKEADKKDGEKDAAHDAETVVKDTAEPDGSELNHADYGVLQQLGERRKQLDEREKQLDQREALLKAARAELAEKYKELDAVRAEIKALLGQQSEAEEAKLKSLVKVYEGMKPAEAAGILNSLETEVLMQVMDRMSERKMSPILAKMNPEVAREVTTRLARQRKLPEGDGSPAASAPSSSAVPEAEGAEVPMPPKS